MKVEEMTAAEKMIYSAAIDVVRTARHEDEFISYEVALTTFNAYVKMAVMTYMVSADKIGEIKELAKKAVK